MIRTAAFLLLTTSALALPEASPLEKLSSEWRCDKCIGFAFPGTHLASPHTTYRIDSDLPELYSTNGVLYTTRAVLPPFDTHSDGPVPLEMRTQVSNGFSTINDSFELFLYHLSVAHQPGETRRIVVYVKNAGEGTFTLEPRQVVLHGPNAAQPTSVESDLAKRVMMEEWDRPFESVVLAPGTGAVIGSTLQIGAAADGPDASRASFVNGILRSEVKGVGMPNLEVSVVSIPGDVPPQAWSMEAEKFLDIGAKSAETGMDLRIPPPICHVRRVGGVSPNVMWRNDPKVIDVAALPQDDVFFQMANFSVQSVECPVTRQSVDMLLYPPYVHPDSIGNYMMEYHVTMQFINSGETPRTFDVMFGKDDAPIGLAWQMIVGPEEAHLEELEPLPVKISWAGLDRMEGPPWFRKTMLDGGPLTLAPGESTWVSMRLMAIGTSSLPWQLHVAPVK
jgi:hypothetical protein